MDHQPSTIGILGLVFKTISDKGIGSLANYGILLGLLVTTMFFVALVVNPLIAFSLYEEKILIPSFGNVCVSAV